MEFRCKVLRITTPKKFLLDGLWFGNEKAKKVLIFVHGLTGNAFATSVRLVAPLASKELGVITFSNRGHDIVTKVRKIDQRKKKGYNSVVAGEAHEVFADCIDDIQAVINYAKSQGAKEVYLAGHSTGCQKSTYYLAQREKQKQVMGVILLCPISDYSSAKKFEPSEKLNKATAHANRAVSQGKPHQLLPEEMWDELIDAQRFLSLYTPKSPEEIFTYARPKVNPSTLKKVRVPKLVVLAGADEYGDVPARKIAAWFMKIFRTNLKVSIINKALHGFNKQEGEVAKEIAAWINTLTKN